MNEGLKVGANGILVPVRQIEALVSAMEYILSNPSQIALMGVNSRAYARERFNVHDVNAVLLKEIMDGR